MFSGAAPDPNAQFILKIQTKTGKQINVLVNAKTMIQDVKQMIQYQEGLPIDQQRLVLDSLQLQDHKTIQDYSINSESKVQLILRLMGDIGIFGTHEDSLGRKYLINSNQQAYEKEEIQQIIKKLRGNVNAKFTLSSIEPKFYQNLDILVKFADQQYIKKLNLKQSNNTQNQNQNIKDLKITLPKHTLIHLTTPQFLLYLQTIFNDTYSQILIRRCQQHGKFINFHTDTSLKTLQVSLNDDHDYQGGKLIYAMNGQLIMPKRYKGSITVHDNGIVHGVTGLGSGVRYGLFLLKKQ